VELARIRSFFGDAPYFIIRSYRSAISCAPFSIRSHETRQSIGSCASSAANQRPCTGSPKLKPGLSSKASVRLKRRRTAAPHPFSAVAVMLSAVAVVGQRVCATEPVAGADYSLRRTTGTAGERCVGGGGGGGGGGVVGAVAWRRRWRAPRRRRRAPHCTLAQRLTPQATGLPQLPAWSRPLCQLWPAASVLRLHPPLLPPAPFPQPCSPPRIEPQPHCQPRIPQGPTAQAYRQKGPSVGGRGGGGGRGAGAALRSDGARAGAVAAGADGQGSMPLTPTAAGPPAPGRACPAPCLAASAVGWAASACPGGRSGKGTAAAAVVAPAPAPMPHAAEVVKLPTG